MFCKGNAKQRFSGSSGSGNNKQIFFHLEMVRRSANFVFLEFIATFGEVIGYELVTCCEVFIPAFILISFYYRITLHKIMVFFFIGNRSVFYVNLLFYFC